MSSELPGLEHHSTLPLIQERTGLAMHELDAFVSNSALDDLASIYGVNDLPAEPYARLSALHSLSQQWDFRQRRERQEVAWAAGTAGLSEDDRARVERSARALGMVDSSIPQNRQPTYGLVLGGANRAPLDRLSYLTETITAGTTVYVGSSRRTSEKERQAAREYAPITNWDEYDLGRSAIRHRLGGYMVRAGAHQRSGEDNRAWTEFRYEDRENGVTRIALALSTPYEIADSQGHHSRATTSDNLTGFAEHVRLERQPDATVVVATTGLYRPAQHLAAVEALTLGFGIPVETIGHDAQYSGVQRTAEQYLNEIKAAIDAAIHLRFAIDSAAF